MHEGKGFYQHFMGKTVTTHIKWWLPFNQEIHSLQQKNAKSLWKQSPCLSNQSNANFTISLALAASVIDCDGRSVFKCIFAFSSSIFLLPRISTKIANNIVNIKKKKTHERFWKKDTRRHRHSILYNHYLFKVSYEEIIQRDFDITSSIQQAT